MASKKMYASAVIDVAMKEVGYLEKKSPKYLNSKTKNAGYNNYTKYGKAYGMNGVYWCCEFAWWCHYKAFGGSNYREDGTIKTAACESMRQRFKKIGRYDKTPKKGDYIFFKTKTTDTVSHHIGLVYKVTSSRVYTIEGNTNAGGGLERNGGGVAKKSYPRSYAHIMGYGHPKYDTKPLSAPKAPLDRGAEGESVKKLQKCLNKVLKISLKVDGHFGESTAKAIKSFKAKYGKTYHIKNRDSHYGAATQKAINKQLKKS